jgi:hypothetical protein
VVFWRTDLVRGLPGPALRFVEQFGAAGVVATGAFSLADRSVYVSTALLPLAFIFAIAFKASLALKPPRMFLATISPLFLIRILLFKLSIPL